jgi:HAD superfamily hydrolase (TIGR01509 family)
MPRGKPSDEPDRDTAWGLANRKDTMFRRAVLDEGVRTFPSAVALVRSLQGAGFRTAVVTASRNAEMVLEAAGLAGLFAVRVDGVESARLSLPGKPSPAVFLEAARRLGAAAGRTVVVEDAVSGVRAGHAGGFGLVIGVAGGAHAVALREAGADVVLEDLAVVRVVG